MTIHYRLLEPPTSESQCRCATSDGIRCPATALPGHDLCTGCEAGRIHAPVLTEIQLPMRTGFGWWNTAGYDRRVTDAAV